jgi:hypothetical protein
LRIWGFDIVVKAFLAEGIRNAISWSALVVAGAGKRGISLGGRVRGLRVFFCSGLYVSNRDWWFVVSFEFHPRLL